jgi:ribosomal protein L7/L12
MSFLDDWEETERQQRYQLAELQECIGYYDYRGTADLESEEMVILEIWHDPIGELTMNNGMMTVEQSTIVNQVDDLFSICHTHDQTVRDLNKEIRDLEMKREFAKAELEIEFIKLLCLVTVDHRRYNGRNHKVPLIKLHRMAYGSGLREAKEMVEFFIQPERDNDIPF